MTDKEFNDIKRRIEAGEEVSVVDRFLYDLERLRREAGPNVLERGQRIPDGNELHQAGKTGKVY